MIDHLLHSLVLAGLGLLTLVGLGTASAPRPAAGDPAALHAHEPTAPVVRLERVVVILPSTLAVAAGEPQQPATLR